MLFITAVCILMVNFSSAMRLPAGSGIRLGDLWNLTNVSCGNETEGVYRHDYIDNPVPSCVRALYLYFNDLVFIKYVDPITLKMNEILPTFSTYGNFHDGTNVIMISPPPSDQFLVGTSDNYEYLWLNGSRNTLNAGVYFKEGDKESPIFVYSYPGSPYTVGMHPKNLSGAGLYSELVIRLAIEDNLGDCKNTYSISVPMKTCPAPPSIDMDQETEFVILGADVSITCYVRILDLQVKWTFRDSSGTSVDITEINDQGKYDGGTLQSPALSVSDFKPSDQGVYTCQTWNLLGWSIGQKLQLLLTEALPNISITPTSVTVNQSESVILSCSVTGYPDTKKIYWIKSVNDTNQATLDITAGEAVTSSSIEFQSVEVTDSGNYTCFAENRVGTARSLDIQLTVLPIDGVETTVDTVDATVDTTVDTVDTVETTVATVDTTVATVDTVETTVDSVETTVDSVETTVDTVDPMCPCSCTPNGNFNMYANYTTAELYEVLAPALKKLEELLTVNKKGLSSYINKHTSAPDSRTSSRSLGIGGIIFLCLVIGCIVLIDISSLFSNHCRGNMRKNKFH